MLGDLRKKDARWHTREYTIRRGDNLWTVARKFGVDHRLIIRINDIKNPDALSPGKKITVPSRSGLYYTVRRGDTLGGIASRHGINARRITSHNGITPLLKPGMRIFLPGAATPVPKHAPVRNERSEIAVNQAPEKISSKMTFSWPVRGRITSSFGNRRDPFTKTARFHCGIDISLDPGNTDKGRGGRNGYIQRLEGGLRQRRSRQARERFYITVYAHNKTNAVNEGAEVKRGQEISAFRHDRARNGAPLHFEIRKYLTRSIPQAAAINGKHGEETITDRACDGGDGIDSAPAGAGVLRMNADQQPAIKVFYHEEDTAGWNAVLVGKLEAIGMKGEVDKNDITATAQDRSKATVRLYRAEGIRQGDELFVINERNLSCRA